MSVMENLTPLPVLPGMHFRFARGPQDAAPLAAIHEARLRPDGVDPTDAYEMTGSAAEFEEALAGQLKEGTLCQRPVVEIDEETVAYGKMEEWKESDGTNVYLLMGWVHPKARGRGIGTALLGWLEREAAALAARDHPGEKCEFAGNASSTETSAAALLSEAGYRAVYTVAELRLDPLRYAEARDRVEDMPAGLVVAIPGKEDFKALTETVTTAFAKEYEEGRFDELVDPEEYEASLSDESRDPSAWRIVRNGSEIVAVALCEIRSAGNIAEIVELAVIPRWRRMGIARALMTETLDAAMAKGATDIRLCTIEQFQTRAIELYQSLGFLRYKDFPRYRKPMPA